MRPAFAVPRPSGAALAAARLLALAAAIVCAVPAAQAQSRVENPFVGATWYLNPEYAKNVAASAAQVSDPTLKARVARVADYPTAFWLDRIAAINGYAGRMGLAAHLDAALAQEQAGKPVVVIVVVYDLPGRDCSALASNGELGPADIDKYKTQFIDPIAAIEGDAKYKSLRIVNLIEIDSLPNIVTNVGGKAGATALCDTMKANGNYVAGIQYALGKLHAAGSNTYNYIDAGHHGWLGWDDNLNAVAQLFADTVKGAPGGYDTVQGFITNTANYSALVEPYLTVTDQTRASKWIDWNRYVDERSYASAMRTKLTSVGFSSSIGMLIDTSRNGWGGPGRPTQASTSSDVNTMVNASRIDRRIHAGNWCNQSGAGIGERPQAVGADGIHAYVWAKPPGESDGASKTIPNPDGKSADQMCDPAYTGNARNGNNLTGALADAPLAGAWFHSQLVELVQNAYPAVPADGGSSSGGSSSGGSSSGGSSSGGSSSGGSSADFQLAASPASVTLNQGQSGASTILLGKSGGFSASVSLSASGLPAGVTASFQPASTSGQSVVTFSATSSAATGTTTATITGTSGGLTHTVNVFLTVNAAGSPSFALSTSPASLSIAQGASASSTVSVQPSDGFSGTVGLSAEGLPSGVTATFDNQYPTSSTKVTFTATATAATGSAIATIVGTAGNVTRSTTVALTVTGSSGGSSSGGSSSGGSSSGGSSSGGSGSGGSSGGASSSGGTSSGGGSSSGGSSGGTSSGGGSSSGGPRQPGSVGGCSSTGAADAGAFLIALLGAARLRLRRRPV